MGIFNRTPKPPPAPPTAEELQRRQETVAEIRRNAIAKHDASMRSMAKTNGFPTAGAAAVLHEGVMTPKCIVVRDGQVEYFTKETGALWQSTNGRQIVMAMSDVSSVHVEKKSDTDSVFSISGSSGGFSVKAFTWHAEWIRDEVLPPLLANAQATAQAPSPEAGNDSKSPSELLKELAALHADGILSDDEFATKKAEILGRM